MQIPIKRTLERLPGGMMIGPLALGCALANFFPSGPQFFGSFTGALFSSPLTILAVFFVCLGSTISIHATPEILKKGGVLLLTKVFCGVISAIVLKRLLGEGPVESGIFAGLSTLAVVAAINDTNGGLYMALMAQFGKPDEAAAFSIMSMEAGPFLTMVSLGIAGSEFPWPTLVGAILPLILGMILGNLDDELRDFLGRVVPVLIPFFAFALGAGIDARKVWHSGMVTVGLGLGVTVVVISGALLLVADRMTGGNGTAGLAAASTAGNAAAVPTLVAAENPAYGDAAKSATVLVSASILVTAFLVPVITAWWAGTAKRRFPV